jgi:hypothetical protein
MAPAATPELVPGTVLRTAALRRWGANPTRLAQRLEARGVVQRIGHGFVYVPKGTRFGTAPPTEEALLDALLGGAPYVVTGPLAWNALGLGSTAMFAHPLVYNTKRSGTVRLADRTLRLRRVAFPSQPCPEWFVIDLLENARSVGLDRQSALARLRTAVRGGRFDEQRLLQMAERFAGADVGALVTGAVRDAAT